MICKFFGFVATAAACGWFAAAHAQTARPAAPVVVDKQAAQATRAAAARLLIEKARRQGEVRVIVGLGLSLQPHDRLGPAAAAAQQRALRAAQDALLTRSFGTGAAGATRFDYIPFVSVAANAAQVAVLVADAGVSTVQEDLPMPPALRESVPYVHADALWRPAPPANGHVVAILDTGVEKNHPMFGGDAPAGKVVAEACYSTSGRGSRSLCPGGAAASVDPGSGLPCPLSITGCDHGTHVAGIAAGHAQAAAPAVNAGRFPNGVARDARIIAMQVFSKFNILDACPFEPPCILAYTTDIIKAMERVYALRTSYPIAAVNLSLGGGLFEVTCDFSQYAIADAIKLLRSARIATVIASGNQGADGAISSPACVSAAIAVGSSHDNADILSGFSNHSPQVRVVAPGQTITSAVPRKGVGDKNGTSMATPHVTGAYALLRDVKRSASVGEIAAALECTGAPVERAGVTEPRIDLAAARAYLVNPPTVASVFEFDSQADAASWPALMGAWTVDGGRYKADDSVGWKVSSTANCNDSLTIQARMRRTDKPDNRPFNSGVFFKAQIDPVGKTVSGYFAAYNTFQVGQVFLSRLTGYNLVTQAGLPQILCVKEHQPAVKADGFNMLQVVSRAGRHRVFLNGVLMCDVTDFTYGTGHVAVASYFSPLNKRQTFVVDRVTIASLDPAAEDVAGSPDTGAATAHVATAGIHQAVRREPARR